MAAHSLMERVVSAGTTDAEKLSTTLENYSFDGAKSSKSVYHGWDHQCAQDVYAGASISSKAFAKSSFMYEIVSEVPAAESDGNADSPWAKAATTALAAQHPTARAGYTPKTV